MKKIFIVLAMLMSCSLFAEITQNEMYVEQMTEYGNTFTVTYSFTKNLSTNIPSGKIMFEGSYKVLGRGTVSLYFYDGIDFYKELRDYLIFINRISMVTPKYELLCQRNSSITFEGYKIDFRKKGENYYLWEGSTIIADREQLPELIKIFSDVYDRYTELYNDIRKVNF